MNNKKISSLSKASGSNAELLLLLEELSTIKPKVVLEIGVHQGYSLLDWSLAFAPEILIGVETDMDYFKVEELRENVVLGDSQAIMTFEAVKERLQGKKIDFLFLDGSHKYSDVKKDFNIYSALVRKGGIVALHDINRTDPMWEGVVDTAKVFTELKEKFKSKEIKTGLPDDPGFGLIYLT